MVTWLGSALRVTFCVILVLSLSASQRFDHPYWSAQLSPQVTSATYAASSVGVAQASHQLGDFYWQRQQRARALRYYQRAVTQGDAQAAYRLAQLIPNQHELWTRRAALLGHPEAILSLIEQTIQQDPKQASELLNLLANSQGYQSELATLLFNHPWLRITPRWQDLHNDDPWWRTKTQLAEALAQDEHRLTLQRGVQSGAQRECQFSVAVSSNGGNARSTLYAWLTSLVEHPFATLGLCVTEYTESLACAVNAAGRIQCDALASQSEDAWVQVVDIEVLQPRSKVQEVLASVGNRTMTISSHAEFEVFVHELGHLLGLADEYAMRPSLAQRYCAGEYRFDALNLVITPANPYVDADTLERIKSQLPWQHHLEQPIAEWVTTENNGQQLRLGSSDTSKIGLFAVDTCAGTSFQAWRPVAQRTFMEQHELGSIPELYLRLIEERLQQ